MKKAELIVISLLLFSNSFSQCCSGGVPVSGTISAISSEKNVLETRLTYDLNVLNSLFEGSFNLEDRTRSRQTHSGLLEVNYGITDRISTTTLFSFVRQERRISTIPGLSNFTFSQGLGDIIALIKYKVIRPSLPKPIDLSIGVGPKIPLGSSNRLNNLGIELPADMQPGSGAWDAILWTALNASNVLVKNLSFSLISNYRITGVNPNYLGNERYQFGNEFSFILSPAYRFTTKRLIIDLSTIFRYRNQANDRINNLVFPNSGGNFITYQPNISIQPTPNFSYSIGAALPLYRNVDGTQLASSYRFQGAIYWRFSHRQDQNSSL